MERIIYFCTKIIPENGYKTELGIMGGKKQKLIESWIRDLCKPERAFWGSIFVPFLLCLKHKAEFFIWAMFILVAGQLGTIINVINRVVFQDWTIMEALYPDSIFGNFYTYALVLVASLIAPLLTRINNNEEPRFRTITTIFSTILIFTLILTAVFFSFASQQIQDIDYTNFSATNLEVDTKQLVFFILSVVFAWYSFGLSLMWEDEVAKQLDEDYQKIEDEAVDKMAEFGEFLNNDGEGVAL